ncbi:MAG: JAB domain-containing protein [Eubacteriales bacterium]
MTGFLPHEMLELLLFYALPYKDTKPLARRLLDRFTSPTGVFDATEAQLLSVEGIGQQTAALFALVRHIGERAAQMSESSDPCYNDYERMGEFVLSCFEGETQACTYLILLNNRFQIISSRKVFEGRFSSAALQPKMLVLPALEQRASMAVLASSHPDRIPRPDEYEVETTRAMSDAFYLVGVKLLEHYIVSGHHYVPISRCIPGGLEEPVAYDHFNASRTIALGKEGKP